METMTEPSAAAVDESVRRAMERIDELEAAEAALAETRALVEAGFLVPSLLMLVAEFHGAFGVPVRQQPGIPPDERAQLRIDLMTEELNDLVAAVQMCEVPGGGG